MKYLLSVLLFIGFTGCESKITETRHLRDGGITEIDKDVYVKGIKIYRNDYDSHTIYVYCDKDGNIIQSTPISVNYKEGKHFTTHTTM